MMKNIKHFKSTILGLVFLGLATYLLIQNITQDRYVLGFLFISGLSLLFSPDVYINRLEKLIIGKELFKREEDKEEVS